MLSLAPRYRGKGCCDSRALGKGFKSSVPGEGQHISICCWHQDTPSAPQRAKVLSVHTEAGTNYSCKATVLLHVQKVQERQPRRCRTQAACFPLVIKGHNCLPTCSGSCQTRSECKILQPKTLFSSCILVTNL